MSVLLKKSAAPAPRAGADVLSAGMEARDMVREHLNTSLALCDDVLARCEQMKSATRKQ